MRGTALAHAGDACGDLPAGGAGARCPAAAGEPWCRSDSDRGSGRRSGCCG